jgi:hypothetical protein
MIFATENAIQKIVFGEKTQTRRLVKKGDCFNNKPGCEPINAVVSIPIQRMRWQVGKDYAVQSGRGKPCVWYCPKCKRYFEKNKNKLTQRIYMECACQYEPLRIRITSICKEKLLDISEEDAKKEGFNSRAEFLLTFTTINNPHWKKRIPKITAEDFVEKYLKKVWLWNPGVWVLEFSVV